MPERVIAYNINCTDDVCTDTCPYLSNCRGFCRLTGVKLTLINGRHTNRSLRCLEGENNAILLAKAATQ